MATRRKISKRILSKAEIDALVALLAGEEINVDTLSSITGSVTVSDENTSASGASYQLQAALLEELRALRRQQAEDAPGFVVIPDGPAFWAQ